MHLILSLIMIRKMFRDCYAWCCIFLKYALKCSKVFCMCVLWVNFLTADMANSSLASWVSVRRKDFTWSSDGLLTHKATDLLNSGDFCLAFVVYVAVGFLLLLLFFVFMIGTMCGKIQSFTSLSSFTGELKCSI